MYALLSQRRLRWRGYTGRMKDGRIPKDILYGEMVTGKYGLFTVTVMCVGGT